MAKLTKGERFIYLWQHDGLSGFYQKLVELMAVADDDNLDKIEVAFPKETAAMKQYRWEPGWWQDVLLKTRTNDVVAVRKVGRGRAKPGNF